MDCEWKKCGLYSWFYFFPSFFSLVTIVTVLKKKHFELSIMLDFVTLKFINIKGCILTVQILSLLFKGHQFECHKSQDYWRLIWSLTLSPRVINKKNINFIICKKIKDKRTKIKNRWKIIFHLLLILWGCFGSRD